MRHLALVTLLLVPAGLCSAQAYVDRGVADIDPNAASLRVLWPGLGQFSTDGALIDRFASPGSLDRRLSPFVDQRVSQRYLFQTPGVAAVFNRSDYLTPDGLGDTRLNVTNANTGQIGFPIIPADTVFILTPELLNPLATQAQVIPDDPNFVDNRINPRQDSQLSPNNRIDARYLPDAQPILDIQAIQQRHQRDPILVERSRLLREERAAEAAAALVVEPNIDEADGQDAEDATQADEGSNENQAAQDKPVNDTPEGE